MGVLEILTIFFVILKLTGVVTWSWWVVFIPLIAALITYAIMLTAVTVFQATLIRSINKDFKIKGRK